MHVEMRGGIYRNVLSLFRMIPFLSIRRGEMFSRNNRRPPSTSGLFLSRLGIFAPESEYISRFFIVPRET